MGDVRVSSLPSPNEGDGWLSEHACRAAEEHPKFAPTGFWAGKKAPGQRTRARSQDGLPPGQEKRSGRGASGRHGREPSVKLSGRLSGKLSGTFLRVVAVVWLSLGIFLCPADPAAFAADAHAAPAVETAAAGSDDKAAQNPGKDAGNNADRNASQPDAALEPRNNKGPFSHVFGTLSIRRPLKLFPFWQSVLERNAEHPVFQDETKMGRRTWASIKKKASTLKGLELLRYVNSQWNAFPYVEDIVNWGRKDYWEAPYEFLQKSGDCEDYAIIKYMTLRQLGVPADDMRILVVKDSFRNLDHAVLGVNVDGTVYILDNVSNVVLSHGRLTQYTPEFSVNESGAWMHMRPSNSKKKKPARRPAIQKLVPSAGPDDFAYPARLQAIVNELMRATRAPAP